MQKQTKEKLIGQLDELRRLHKKLNMLLTFEGRLAILKECQRIAIAIGECIEQEPVADTRIVSGLEDYCEQAYVVSGVDYITQRTIDLLAGSVEEVSRMLEKIPDKYRVVFLPYKVEMWDSLESIWRACREDERCECSVVPIPYFEANTVEQKWEYRYDGERFPKDVPITYYRDYDLERYKPDIAYIHNPYDDNNVLTSVFADYYSRELKKHVGKLVYVPYYVTPGWIAKDHLYFPSYKYMDYMVVQSKYAKECFNGLWYQEKLLPLGSPKLDKIIQACQNPPAMPKEWEKKLRGKKILLLNIGVGDFYTYGERMFRKVRQIFEFVKKRKDMALIWRPHPLLKVTIGSVRPKLLEDYKKLVETFLTEEIGVYDTTSEVEASLTLCDGYIDAGGSSVVNLAGVAGKPIFIMSYLYSVEREKTKPLAPRFYGMAGTEESVWFVSDFNALFRWDRKEKYLQYAGRNKEEALWAPVYSDISVIGDSLWLCPQVAGRQAFADLQPESGTENREERIRSCEEPADEEGKAFFRMLVWRDFVIYLSGDKGIVSYCRTNGEWQEYAEAIEQLWKDTVREPWMGAVFDACIQGDDLWVTTGYHKKVLKLCLQDGAFCIYEPQSDASGYGAVCADGNGVWLSDPATGDLIHWKPESGNCQTYPAPDSFRSWPIGNSVRLAHRRLLEMGEYIIALPHFANGILRLHKADGRIEQIADGFLADVEEAKEGYDPFLAPVVSVMDGRLDEEHLLVQRMSDGKLACIDIREDTYEELEALLSKEDLREIKGEVSGFEKASKREGFWCRENLLFSMEEFFMWFLEGDREAVRKRQMDSLSVTAANLDGTCGKKVHEYMIGILQKEQQNEESR